jgi:hypothetical protein
MLMNKLAIFVLAGVVLSNELIEDLLRNLSQQPYATAAPLIAKIQNEAAHQPTPMYPPSAPDALKKEK